MASHSPSQAKNAIRRSLLAIVDPELSNEERATVRAYFENRCAYCDRAIETERAGHIDHLESRANDGRNHIFNRVLACALCNGDLKREGGWEEFLKNQSPDPAAFTRRRDRIREWRNRHARVDSPAERKLLAIVKITAESACAAYDESVKKVRELYKAHLEDDAS